MRFLIAVALCALPAVAQVTAVTPNPASPVNLDRPFPGGIGRYQQWYPAAELAASFSNPVRIEQLEFFAGSSATNATTIDMEVTVAHAPALGLASAFDSNYLSSPVVVWPRGNIQLAAGAPGSVVMTIPFAPRFTWDGSRALVVDIKIFGNSRNSQPFSYDLRGTSTGIGVTCRNYAFGNASATVGSVQVGWGLRTRLTARPGAVVEFGTGCVGGGNVVPHNATLNQPFPSTTWQNQLTGAASQAFAVMLVGVSNATTTTQPPIPLPVDLGTMFGLPALNCNLLVDAGAVLSTVTVGGGPGSGVANLPLSMPPVTWYVGMSLYTQWFVLDPLAPNGTLSATNGVRMIVAPVGG